MNDGQERTIVPLVADEQLKQIIKDAERMIEERRNAEPKRIIEF